jgi:hypothetical protein
MGPGFGRGLFLALPLRGRVPILKAKEIPMPASSFFLLILSVLAMAGATLGLAFWSGIPLAALGMAGLVAALGLRGLAAWH